MRILSMAIVRRGRFLGDLMILATEDVEERVRRSYAAVITLENCLEQVVAESKMRLCGVLSTQPLFYL